MVCVPRFRANSEGEFLNIFNCLDVPSEVRVPDGTGILQVWSDQGFIELHQSGRAGELVKVSIEHPHEFSGSLTDLVNMIGPR